MRERLKAASSALPDTNGDTLGAKGGCNKNPRTSESRSHKLLIDSGGVVQQFQGSVFVSPDCGRFSFGSGPAKDAMMTPIRSQSTSHIASQGISPSLALKKDGMQTSPERAQTKIREVKS